jgi:hypothetical protein
MNIKDLVNAVASEHSLVRSLGISGIHFTVEVHLTKPTLEYLRTTAYINILPNEDNITFMNCPVIEDTTDFVCTVHRINFNNN